MSSNGIIGSVEQAHDYAFSRRKRLLSYSVGALLIPLNAQTRLQTWRDLRGTGYTTRFTQPRYGRRVDGELTIFDMHKLRTMDMVEGIDVIVGESAPQRRSQRHDETEQLFNIFGQTMLAFGRRPEHLDEYANFMDQLNAKEQARYQRIVEPTYTGLWSTFAIESARGNKDIATDAQAKYEMNVEDVMRGSIRYDLSLLKWFLALSASQELVDLQVEIGIRRAGQAAS